MPSSGSPYRNQFRLACKTGDWCRTLRRLENLTPARSGLERQLFDRDIDRARTWAGREPELDRKQSPHGRERNHESGLGTDKSTALPRVDGNRRMPPTPSFQVERGTGPGGGLARRVFEGVRSRDEREPN